MPECQNCNSELEYGYYYQYSNTTVCETCNEESGCVPEDEVNKWYCYDDLFYFKANGKYYRNSSIKPHWFHKENGLFGKLPNSRSGKYLGFELELLTPKAVFVANKISNKNIFMEYDGSLGEEGFEICSKYGDIQDILDLANETLESLKPFKVKSENTNTCGLHVHLSRSIFDKNSLAKFIVFWNEPKNSFFLKKFTRRWTENEIFNSYSKVNKSATFLSLKENGPNYILETNSNRKMLINSTSNNETVEIRGFKGTLNPLKMCACLELSYYSAIFCSQKPKSLFWKDFISWLDSTPSKYIRKLV